MKNSQAKEYMKIRTNRKKVNSKMEVFISKILRGTFLSLSKSPSSKLISILKFKKQDSIEHWA